MRASFLIFDKKESAITAEVFPVMAVRGRQRFPAVY